MEYPLLHQTSHEQTLRLPLEAALSTDQRTEIQAGSNLSIVQRLNESLASVQQSELTLLTWQHSWLTKIIHSSYPAILVGLKK